MTDNLVFISPQLIGGGIESSIPNLISTLNALGGRKFWWIGLNESTYKSALPNTRILSLARGSKDGFWNTFKTFRCLIEVLRETKEPIIVINGELAELYSLALIHKYRVIFVEHASIPWRHHRLLGWIVRSLLSRFDTTWVSVNTSQTRIWPNIEVREVIPNPVSICSPKIDDYVHGLVFIGRLNEDKGIRTICDAAEFMKVDLDIYGDGPIKSELQSRYHLCVNIKFHGFTENPWQLVGKNKLFVSNSLHEGDGKAVAEAIVRSQPVLVRNTNDHRRFALNESSFFNDFTSLCSSIQNYINEGPSLFLPPSTTIRNESLKRDPHQIALAWEKLLFDIE